MAAHCGNKTSTFDQYEYVSSCVQYVCSYAISNGQVSTQIQMYPSLCVRVCVNYDYMTYIIMHRVYKIWNQCAKRSYTDFFSLCTRLAL